MTRRPRRSGLTLIELMAIIAVVAVILALLVRLLGYGGENARRARCADNLKQIGLALHKYESVFQCFPPAGASTNYQATPPATQFIDGGHSALGRLLPFLEGGGSYAALNLSLDYNDRSGANHTAASQVVGAFLCPSAGRDWDHWRDDPADPNGAPFETTGIGYGLTDYAPTHYTDINPSGETGGPGSTPIVPFRNTIARMNGLLKSGATRLSECFDGTSRTIAFAEVAGRDASYASPFAESYSGGSGPSPARNVPGFAAGAARRSWRWAEPDSAIGVSGRINNPARPMHEAKSYPATSAPTAGNEAGANGEVFSDHPDGANVLFGDGSLKFLRDSTDAIILQKFVTLQGVTTCGPCDY